MRKALVILSLLATGLAAAAAKKPELSLADGRTFHHPKIGPSCLGDKECAAEGAQVCRSKKANFRFCAEQYSGAWTTTCVCGNLSP